MKSVKTQNIQNVIRTIYNYEPISKPEIAKRLGLTTPSVHNFINELMQQGIVMESGMSESTGGRKAVFYTLNPDCGYLIGVNITADHFLTVVFNMRLKLLYLKKHPIYREYKPKALNDFQEAIELALRETGVPAEKILGIGISVPGLVNHDTGDIRLIPQMPGWDNVPLKAYLEEQLGIPVIVDNNANGMALSEMWMAPQVSRSVSVIVARIGVGVGVADDGNVFRGANGSAGEIGHTCINPNGPRCSCGNPGCIESYYSRCEEKLITALETALHKHYDDITAAERNEFLCNADSHLQCLVWELADYLSLAADVVIKCYSPKRLVFYCDWFSWNQNLCFKIMENIYARNPFLNKNEITISFAPSSENLYQGAIQVLHDAFYSDFSRLMSQLAI